MKEYVTIPKELYTKLIGFVEAELEDIESGIEEGVYEDSPDNSTRMIELEDMINGVEVIHPEVYVFVEGGNIQGASATCGMGFQVFDKDNYDDDPNYVNGLLETENALDDWNKMIEEGHANGTLKSIY